MSAVAVTPPLEAWLDAAVVPADVRLREELGRLCLLALALDRRDARMLDAAAEAGSLDRLATVLAERG